MSIKDRRDREKDEKCKLILSAAGEIIASEGIDKLSIRKIANKIEYSPAIIYYYFKDKDDILMQFMSKKYAEIISRIRVIQESDIDPILQLKNMTYTYINWALEIPELYMTVMLSADSRIIEHTSVLSEESFKGRKLIQIFHDLIYKIYKDKNIDTNQLELNIQFIWTSTFGLIIRLITEKKLSEQQREKLITNHVDIIFNKVLSINY